MTPELQAVLNRSPVWQRLYDTDPRYRTAWDAGTGPGQSGPQPDIHEGPRYNHWGPLHWYAVEHAADWKASSARVWYARWVAAIPSTGCNCGSKWASLGMLPDFTSALAFFESAWYMHDVVTARLNAEGKLMQRYSLDEAYSTWFCDRS